MAYEINYDDKRFAEVEADKNAAIKEAESTYQGMIDKSQGFYQAQIDAAEDYKKQQTKLQAQQTDFAIEQIEQQKEQAEKDYHKEQSAAYVDWQKQSNDYGSNAEKMADAGLAHSGYSESSKVAMYNQYQNRVATARESFNKAVLNYDNAIKDARLQNNAVLAEIAYQTLQTKLELSLQGFQYENQLILDRLNYKTQLDQTYYNRYQDVLNQMNTENSMAEQVRQFNASLAEDQRQFNMSYNKSSGGSSGGSSGIVNKFKSSNTSKQQVKQGKDDKVSSEIKEASKSYKNAAQFLKDNGKANLILGHGGSMLIDEKAWNASKKHGRDGAEYEHATYQDYLQDYLEYAMSF